MKSIASKRGPRAMPVGIYRQGLYKFDKIAVQP